MNTIYAWDEFSYLVASFTSMLSTPTPARPTMRIFFAALRTAGVTFTIHSHRNITKPSRLNS